MLIFLLFEGIFHLQVSDTVLFVWPPGEDLDDNAELILSSILAQGLPSPVHAVLSVEEFAQKVKKTRCCYLSRLRVLSLHFLEKF